MKNVFEAALSDLKDNKKGVIAVIISGSGSTPRGTGAKMYINEAGETTETIGGGPSEYAVVKAVPEILEQGLTVVKTFNMSGEKNGAVSVCGGETKVLMHPVSASDALVLEAVVNAINNRIKADFYVWMSDENTSLAYIDEEREITGNSEKADEIIKSCKSSDVHDDERVIYSEKLEIENKLFLLGAGHVAYYTAIVSQVSGFRTVVIDDRVEFANSERFPGCEIKISSSYKELPIEMITENDYVVIVTRGHVADEEALEWALGSSAAYIGMIGSKIKVKTVFENLLKKGFSQKRLDFVHAPIGLNIGGRTPGEIAVSIMAEIIQTRSSINKER